MRVIFNQWPTRGAKTGVGQYASQLLRSLKEMGSEEIVAYPADWVMSLEREYHHLAAYLAQVRSRFPRMKMRGPNAALCAIARRAALGVSRLAKASMARLHARAFFGRRYDLYHEPNFIPFPSSLPTVTTFHDLSAITHPEWHPSERLCWFDSSLDRALAQSSHFLTVSEFTRQEMIRLLGVAPDRVTCTYNGVRRGLRPLPAEEVGAGLRRLGFPDRYLLYLGTIEPRKNVLRLLSAYCSLPETLRGTWPLLLVGTWGWKAERERDFYLREARHRGVLHIGYVSDDDLAVVYNGARALIYPSYYEGFGLPPVEMMACGGAVLASTAAALVETIGSQAHLVEPEDTDAWRSALLQVTQNDDWCHSLQAGAVAAAQSYTWEQCAFETLRVYRSVLGRPLVKMSGPERELVQAKAA
jgi:glycosyltransferase involved in cell wall biosynthesis